MTNKGALITGVTGQDGAYLAEFQIAKCDLHRTGGVFDLANLVE